MAKNQVTENGTEIVKSRKPRTKVEVNVQMSVFNDGTRIENMSHTFNSMAEYNHVKEYLLACGYTVKGYVVSQKEV